MFGSTSPVIFVFDVTDYFWLSLFHHELQISSGIKGQISDWNIATRTGVEFGNNYTNALTSFFEVFRETNDEKPCLSFQIKNVCFVIVANNSCNICSVMF